MLDENLPTYRFKTSSENPLNNILYFSHNGSDPSPEYLVKRPSPSDANGQYALGMFDSLNTSVIYAEVGVKPDWVAPTLSAAEIRAQNGNPPPKTPATPDNFAVSLYNPDQNIAVKQHPGSWGKSDIWEFELPERSFKLPSASQIDQEDRPSITELVPKVVFRWKRDGRLSKDMTCYMTGRNVGGKKSKEPDITVAFFRAKHDSTLTIYEPNMARVEIEDRRGLEIALLMSAETIKDLYMNPSPDPFNLLTSSNGRRQNSRPAANSSNGPTMAGALNNNRPSSPPRAQPAQQTPNNNAQRQAEVEAETKRLQAMVAEEERKRLEREQQEEEERKRIQKMLETEEQERRKREAEVDQETERLRREFGMAGQDFDNQTAAGHPSPPLPPRPHFSSGALPARPNSVGPAPNSRPQPNFAPPPSQPQAGPSENGKKRHGLGSLLQGPYAGPATASVSGFFSSRKDEEKRKKVQKKRSVHF
ncbi:hypothetical protein NXS19_007401 [Fusarium pseudograminearum]|uniref:Uncharacterized protein n=1 Tax=Fusarium pseudograminearum (strain CS3096) TaxID=1028729 RepID=K3VWQ7_FUSPC|nr:hypothetical protein FPSE_00117 [Fusarium pseudograminearum CS3096]EKJ79663.1 hypothetical protein FPSE_00117 [Fusarium pseudograminearum CS3096]KAF0639101.1 hypothetical protein FPSE5266_00117 [Fusarium pseudograminearum]UZP39585.1 hypothetical protein NXS19_007401 [Fusarium pseudograminearum]